MEDTRMLKWQISKYFYLITPFAVYLLSIMTDNIYWQPDICCASFRLLSIAASDNV
jgi:hypothetical protein